MLYSQPAGPCGDINASDQLGPVNVVLVDVIEWLNLMIPACIRPSITSGGFFHPELIRQGVTLMYLETSKMERTANERS